MAEQGHDYEIRPGDWVATPKGQTFKVAKIMHEDSRTCALKDTGAVYSLWCNAFPCPPRPDDEQLTGECRTPEVGEEYWGIDADGFTNSKPYTGCRAHEHPRYGTRRWIRKAKAEPKPVRPFTRETMPKEALFRLKNVPDSDWWRSNQWSEGGMYAAFGAYETYEWYREHAEMSLDGGKTWQVAGMESGE